MKTLKTLTDYNLKGYLLTTYVIGFHMPIYESLESRGMDPYFHASSTHYLWESVGPSLKRQKGCWILRFSLGKAGPNSEKRGKVILKSLTRESALRETTRILGG